jgi:hypothetical protein
MFSNSVSLNPGSEMDMAADLAQVKTYMQIFCFQVTIGNSSQI